MLVKMPILLAIVQNVGLSGTAAFGYGYVGKGVYSLLLEVQTELTIYVQLRTRAIIERIKVSELRQSGL